MIIASFSGPLQTLQHRFTREEFEHRVERRRLSTAAHEHSRSMRELRHFQAVCDERFLDEGAFGRHARKADCDAQMRHDHAIGNHRRPAQVTTPQGRKTRRADTDGMMD